MRFCLGKKKKKKVLSPESNPGPLILRDSGRYAYNSEGVAGATLKGPGENTACSACGPGREHCKSCLWTR